MSFFTHTAHEVVHHGYGSAGGDEVSGKQVVSSCDALNHTRRTEAILYLPECLCEMLPVIGEGVSAGIVPFSQLHHEKVHILFD